MSVTVTNTVFSTEFYSHDIHFPNAHATVDAQGTFKIVPLGISFNFFKRFINSFQRLFSVTQNANLIAVHKRLQELQIQIQNPASPELQRLKEELHTEHMKGTKGLSVLHSNLSHLNQCFRNGNKAAATAHTLLKVVNHVRSFFKYKPIEHYHYTPIDVMLFQEKAIAPAWALTEQEQQCAKHSFVIRNIYPSLESANPINNRFNLPQAGSETRLQMFMEQMQQLELGLITGPLQVRKLAISYDKISGTFSFSKVQSYLMGPDDRYDPHDDIYLDGSGGPTRSNPITIIEKQASGTIVNHTLQFTHKYIPGSWLPWRSSKWTYESNSVALIPNSEYTILQASRGRNLQITMALRTPQQ